MAYTKTNWVNGTTPLNDKNMNKIENALENLDTNISKSTDEYSSTRTYSIGELVIYNNKLYKANQDITTAEAFNSSHWTEVTLLSDINEIKSVVNNNADNLNKMDEGIANIDTKINSKQDKLTAGTGIEITGKNTINNIQGNYSTDEIRIGTWMGKPLYRKVTPVTTSTTFNYNTWVELNTINVNSVSQIIECKYFANKGYTMPLIAYRGDSGVLNVMNLRNTTIESSNFEILLEYTKTTD